MTSKAKKNWGHCLGNYQYSGFAVCVSRLWHSKGILPTISFTTTNILFWLQQSTTEKIIVVTRCSTSYSRPAADIAHRFVSLCNLSNFFFFFPVRMKGSDYHSLKSTELWFSGQRSDILAINLRHF